MARGVDAGKVLAKRIGRKAREARTAMGLTQAEVSERIDLSAEVYGRLERGGMLPSIVNLMRLSAALRVPPSLFLEEGPAEGGGGLLLAQSTLKGTVEPPKAIRMVTRLMETLPEEDQQRVWAIVSNVIAIRRSAAAVGQHPNAMVDPD